MTAFAHQLNPTASHAERKRKTNSNHWLLWIGLFGVLFLTAVCTLGGEWTHYRPNDQGNLLSERYLAPSWQHPFGTDKFSRDVLSRVLHGGRISLIIGFGVVLLAVSVGVLYGTVSGYAGGKTDAIMMRFLDFLLAFPSVFLIIMLIAVLDMNHWYLIPILALTGWMETARLVRAEVLSLKEREFILAARALGFGHGRILFRHIIPNCLTPVLLAATFKVGEVILLESALSFLGIGVQPPAASWGNIINDGREVLFRAWWISSFPGLMIAFTVLSCNLIGEGLRGLLDARK